MPTKLKTLNESEINMKVIEYKVRPVTRYIVTKYVSDHQVLEGVMRSSSSENCGEFDNVSKANGVAAALARDNQEVENTSEVFYKLYSHEYDETEYPNNGLIKVK